VTAIRDIILCQSGAYIFVGRSIGLPFLILLPLLFPIFPFTLAFVYTIMDLVSDSTSLPADTGGVVTNSLKTTCSYILRSRAPIFQVVPGLAADGPWLHPLVAFIV